MRTAARSSTASAPRRPRISRPGGTLLLVHSDIIGADTTLEAYTATGLVADVAARERGPLGPLLRERRAELEARGQLHAGPDSRKSSSCADESPRQERRGMSDTLITPYRDGPLLVRGPFRLVDQDGKRS